MEELETTMPETTATEPTPGFHPVVETGSETVVYTTVGESVTYEQFQGLAMDMIHVDLFGSFLVCGTLAGIALLWRFR